MEDYCIFLLPDLPQSKECAGFVPFSVIDRNQSSISFCSVQTAGCRFLPGGGFVVAHTPGAGKTLLLILFLVSYLKVHPRSQPLVLTPKAAIHTWRREFQKWGILLPLHMLHHTNRTSKLVGGLSSKLQAVLKNFHQPSRKIMRIMDCLDKLCKWHEEPKHSSHDVLFFLITMINATPSSG